MVPEVKIITAGDVGAGAKVVEMIMWERGDVDVGVGLRVVMGRCMISLLIGVFALLL